MKKTSFLLAVSLIMQMLFLTSVAAMSTSFGDYTPLAVRYSPSADIYVAAAKDLDDNINYPMKLYTSDDGAQWTEQISYAFAKSTNVTSRQILTYWDKENVFVSAVGNAIYYSQDGINWELLTKMGNNVIVDSYGDYLGISTYGKVRLYTSLSDYTDVTLGGGGSWGNVICVGNGIFYISDIQEGTTAYAYYLSLAEDGTFTQSVSYPNKVSATVGVSYMPEFNSWINAYGKTSYNNQKNGVNDRKVKFSDGSENVEIISASGYFDRTAFLATENGSVYYSYLTSAPDNNTVWKKAIGTEINSKIYAMTTGRDNCLLMLTQEKTYAVIKKDNDYVKVAADETIAELENSSSVEIPISGVNQLTIIPKLVNYAGNNIDKCVDSVRIKGTLPTGITFIPAEQLAPLTGAGTLNISSEVSEGCTVTVVVEVDGKEYEFEIYILSESKIEINGDDEIIVPSWGNQAKTSVYTADIYDQNDNIMSRSSTLSALSLPKGVLFDENTNTLTVPYTASAGTAILEAVSNSNSNIKKQFSINISVNEPDKVVIDKELSAINVSQTVPTKINLNASLYNKTGDSVSKEALSWSITSINGEALNNVEINDNDKTATFPAGFCENAVMLRATAKGYPDVYDEIVSLVLYNDEKRIEADLEYIAGKYNFINLDNDVTLDSVCKYGSTLVWNSSDESVITNSGVISRESAKNQAVMTATLNCGTKTRTYAFTVTLSAVSNILKNGNFESGLISPWKSESGEIRTDTENVNEGTYSAYVENSMSQSTMLLGDHIYALKAFIKAQTAANTQIKLKNGAVIATFAASNSFKEISGIYKTASDLTTDLIFSTDSAIYVDDIKFYDITDKYQEIKKAVEAAETTKLTADIDYAYSLLNSFENSDEKTEFIRRLDSITKIEFEEMNLGSYTFVTSAYNKNDNILIAAAKNFTSGTDSARLYTSFDGGATWRLTLSESNAKNDNHSDTKQILTYWKNQNAFVTILGSKVYYTKDGINWISFSELNTSSGYVVSNGDTLFVAGTRGGKAASDLSGAYIDIETKAGGNFYSHFAVASADGYGIYQQLSTGTSYPTTAYYSKLNAETMLYESTAYYPAAFGLVSDVNYIEELQKWAITTSDLAYLRILSEPVGMSSAQAPSVDLDASGYTTALYDNKILYIANDKGRIFYGNASDITKITGWTEVNYDVKPDSAVSSMKKLANGDIIVFTQSDIYIIENNTVTQNQKKFSIGLNEALRVEVPVTGEKTYSFSSYSKLYDNEDSPYKVVSIKPKEALLDGVSFIYHENSPDNNAICELVVSSIAAGGENIVLNLTAQNGMNKEIEIKLVSEASVTLGGKELIAIPRDNDGPQVYSYNPASLGQDNEVMDRNVDFTVLSMPEKIAFDGENKTLTLTKESGEGTILVKVVSKTTPSLSKIFTIKVEPRKAQILKFDEASSYSVYIPDSGNERIKTPAYVYDQAGIKLNDKIDYTITDEENKVKENITMSGEYLDIGTNAYEGITNLTAYADNGRLSEKVQFTLLYTDNRKLTEDYNALLKQNKFGALEKNASLPLTGLYGSTINYKTSNESVITDSGIITRDYTQNSSAILTVTLTLNDAKLTKTISVVVLKESNIAANGDVELGVTDGWQSLSQTPLAVTQSFYKGNYALYSTMGASYTVNLKNDRTYAAVVYVKSDTTGKVALSMGSDELSSINAANSYKKLDGIFTVGKNSDTNTVIKISGANVTIDELYVFEISLEYDRLLNLIVNAENERTSDSVNNAYTALESFYDLSVKDELKRRIDKIIIKTDGGNVISGGGSSSGGGGGGGVSIPSKQTVSTPDYSEIVDYDSLTFKDLNKHWAKDDVEFMAKKGFVNGKEEGVFDPDAYITRAEFAALLVRTMSISEKEYENSFFDVVSEDWFSKSVQAARDMNYISGSDGLFRPKDLISREEMTKMIVSAFNAKMNKALEKGKAIYYNDIYNISAWAYDYVAAAVNEELVNGMTETTFEPKGKATRAQAVVMLRRLYNKFEAE